jgi:hypothetical protein
MSIAALTEYARRIRVLRRADPNITEPGLAPAFQQFLEQLLAELPAAPALTVSPEYRNPGVGRPDIALIRPGQLARSFVELKAPAKPADPTRWRDPHDRRQFERFSELALWATSNFSELCLLQRGDEIGRATIVPPRALDPDRSDADADRLIASHDEAPLLDLVRLLAIADAPAARDAEELATLMAHSARLVRGIVRDRLAELHEEGNENHALLQVRREFREVLYAHPEAAGYSTADFNKLFSAAFAQTLAFGLLLVREATGELVDDDSWEHMPEEHPLMRTALRVLSLPEVVRDIGIGFSVMRDTVNSFAAEILAIRRDGRDPILYFYEDFLQTFDPEARERYGVYYTPIEVVRYMVGALDRALRDNLGTEGLTDANVNILDPATGTGTFLLGIAERVREQQEAAGGGGMAALALHDLASRMFGFELLVGPYAVAHYRLHHALSRRREEAPADAPPLDLPRLGVYLADTLARPGAAAPAGPLGFVSEGIRDERREANRIKSEQQILAIIGNPPYRRLEEGENETLVGRWMDQEIWDDLKQPVRDAGHGNQLNTFPELSVAFWRWAMWKLFEANNAPRRGVIAFITNRKFLTGWPYAGLRKMMRERFDRIEVIDLRGDVRRGERAGVTADHGVFNIQVGTAITLAIADGSKAEGELAEVRYVDAWAHENFARRAKLDWLEAGAAAGELADMIPVERKALDDMRPRPFLNGDLISLNECFVFGLSGIQTKRDRFVYSPNQETLIDRIQALTNGVDAAQELFSATAKNPWPAAAAQPFDQAQIVSVGYRPFDKRWLYNHSRYIDRPRPELQQVWGTHNAGLYALPSGTGAGPALWCHGLLPDYHAFRGSYGGYAFPLYDRREPGDTSNLAPALLAALSAAYGQPVTAEDAFDAILCLLSATSYTLRFAEDLEDVFPHVPFPADRAVFAAAAALGREIRAVESFARPPDPALLAPGFCRLETQPTGALAPVEFADGALALCDDGSGRVSGLPAEVWQFAVSGYRVLPRWLEARVGLPADFALVRDFRDVAGRIAELIHRFDEADPLLDATLADTLTRDELGLIDEDDDDE